MSGIYDIHIIYIYIYTQYISSHLNPMDLIIRGIYGAHEGYETAEVRDDRRIGGGRGLCGGPGKRVDGVFPGRPQSFRHQRRPVDDYRPGLGGMAQNGGTWGVIFHGEMDYCR